MEDIITGTVRIDEVGQDDKKITVVSDSAKYSFWLTKKDGQPTKAAEAWRQLRPMVGDVIEAQYKEEDAKWEKPDGKVITFKRRTILNLRKVANNMANSMKVRNDDIPDVVTPQKTQGQFVTKEEFDAKIKEMSDAYLRMANKICALEERDQREEEEPLEIEIPEGM